MARRLSKHLWAWGPVVLYLAGIFTVSSLSHPRLGFDGFYLPPKVGHVLAYAGLCFFFFRALRFSCRPWVYRWAPLLALIMASAYGATDEYHQSFVPGRTAAVADWLIDTIGASIATVVLLTYTELHDYPPSKGCDPEE